MSKISVTDVIKVRVKEMLGADNFLFARGGERCKKGARGASGMRSVPIRKCSDSGKDTSPKHVGH